ncbi:hypothetical protein V1511DRAFT_490285 [Dipodascopsis uninucleata]
MKSFFVSCLAALSVLAEITSVLAVEDCSATYPAPPPPPQSWGAAPPPPPYPYVYVYPYPYAYAPYPPPEQSQAVSSSSYAAPSSTVALSTAVSSAAPSATCTDSAKFYSERGWKFINYFWSTFLYPADYEQTLKINSTIFSENVFGIVSATRTYIGRELNTEYIYGLFSQVASNNVPMSMIGYGSAYEIIRYMATQDGIASQAIVNFTIPQLNNYTIPVEVDMWMKMEYGSDIYEDQIIQYDAVFRNFDWVYNSLNALTSELLAASGLYPNMTGEEAFKAVAVESICEVAQKYCTGANVQYSNATACYNYLYNDVRLGTGYEGGMNTVFCRNVHQAMVPFRPEVHCAHIGPSGGDMCRDSDMTYEDVVYEYKEPGYYQDMVYST